MAVHIHKGTGGEKMVKMERGGVVREVRADSIRHLSPDCATLLATMPQRGMARNARTAAVVARTSQCWNQGCWDSYGEAPHEVGFDRGMAVAPEIRAAHKSNRAALKSAAKDAAKAATAAKKSAAKKSTAKKSAAKSAKSAPRKRGESAA